MKLLAMPAVTGVGKPVTASDCAAAGWTPMSDSACR